MSTTTVHWETRLFSDPAATTGRGWDAPTYAGVDDQLSDARSRLGNTIADALGQNAAAAASGAARTGRSRGSRRATAPQSNQKD